MQSFAVIKGDAASPYPQGKHWHYSKCKNAAPGHIIHYSDVESDHEGLSNLLVGMTGSSRTTNSQDNHDLSSTYEILCLNFHLYNYACKCPIILFNQSGQSKLVLVGHCGQPKIMSYIVHCKPVLLAESLHWNLGN